MNLDLRSETQLYLGLFEREVYPCLTRLPQTAIITKVI
jgi:hypothetical protein